MTANFDHAFTTTSHDVFTRVSEDSGLAGASQEGLHGGRYEELERVARIERNEIRATLCREGEFVTDNQSEHTCAVAESWGGRCPELSPFSLSLLFFFRLQPWPGTRRATRS
jgi:hypothetical protein